MKQKKCAHCKTVFMPFRPLQKVCSPMCAAAIVKVAREKQDRKDYREAKQRIKTKRDYIKTAQIDFNRYIRLRDQAKPCISCGNALNAEGVGGGYDSGHYRSVGSAPHLRFDEMNAHGQCKHCNRWLSGNVVNFRLGLIERIGIDEVNRVESDQDPKHYTIEELKEISANYRKLSKYLKEHKTQKCSIDGCDEPITYAKVELCQKHYFRLRRSGTYQLREKKTRVENQAGYQKILSPKHKLAHSDGYVYEHRFKVYEKHGDNLPNCEVCGKETNWESCHIDHIDNDVKNNAIENLRPLCRGCNTWRDREPQAAMLEVNGEIMSIVNWARRDDVKVSHQTIKNRLAKGFSNYEAVYGKRKTRPND